MTETAGVTAEVLGTLLKRARSRYFTVPLSVNLAELRSPLEQGYRNSIYCSATLNQESGKVTGSYCGNRWCLVCNRIRTARAMRKYLPVVREWKDRQLVTLTLKNVPADDLPATIGEMVRGFQAIKLGMRRTDRVRLVALRKLECTYNRYSDEYHPHFHLVVDGRRAARLLRQRWLDRYPQITDGKAQDIRASDDAGLAELFKYFTKLLAKTRNSREGKLTAAPVPSEALDIIFRSMRGRRVYQPVGFRVAVEPQDDEAAELILDAGTAAPVRPDERITWEWSQAATDWVDRVTGECLTGYEPAVNFRRLVESLTPEQLLARAVLPVVRPLELQPGEDAPSEDVARARMRRRIGQMRRDDLSPGYSAPSARLASLLRISAAAQAVLAERYAIPDTEQLALLPDYPAAALNSQTGVKTWLPERNPRGRSQRRQLAGASRRH